MPHAVSAVGGVSLCYDAGGNVVRKTSSLGSQTYEYSAAGQVTDIRDQADNTRVTFGYGPNRERVRRVDYASNQANGAESVVHEVSGAQIRYTASAANGPNQLQEVRRTVGNLLIVQRGSGTTAQVQRLVLLRDAQGSTQQVLGAMTLVPAVNASSPSSFDPWGRRRNGTDWGEMVPAGSESLLRETTRKGYTGYEMAESVGIIHMNGRIYDPDLARFLQADPFVQSPQDLQSWNRYTYGFNNPLVYTDPSGYLSWGQVIQLAVVGVFSYATGGWASRRTRMPARSSPVPEAART